MPDATSPTDAGAADSGVAETEPASPDGGDAAASDPCPGASVGLYASCDPSCPGASSPQECTAAHCGQGYVRLTSPQTGPAMPAVVRTPRLSGLDAGCDLACATHLQAFAYELEFDFEAPPSAPFNITVGTPWGSLAAAPHLGGSLICPISPTSCLHLPGGTTFDLYAVTSDPRGARPKRLHRSSELVSLRAASRERHWRLP